MSDSQKELMNKDGNEKSMDSKNSQTSVGYHLSKAMGNRKE